ncbi:MAG: DNA-binding protein, partial [Chloroflexi bacterium]
MVLDTFISIAEAANRLGTSESQVRAMVDAGKIKGAVINGDLIIREKDMHPKIQPIKQRSKVLREDLPEYKQFVHLRGVPIWVAEAARKYNVAHPNISRWLKSGIIKQLGMDRNRLL